MQFRRKFRNACRLTTTNFRLRICVLQIQLKEGGEEERKKKKEREKRERSTSEIMDDYRETRGFTRGEIESSSRKRCVKKKETPGVFPII